MASVIENGLADTSSGADTFICEDLILTGNVVWVDSVNGNNANPGTQGSPVATLAQAITLSRQDYSDIIIIKSGHQETLTSPIVIGKSGLKIYGIGNGSLAPKFIVNAAIDGIQVTAPSVELNNLYFPAGTTIANTSRIKVDAANVRIKGCTFNCGQYDVNTVRITVNGLYSKHESCSYNVQAAGPSAGLIIQDAAAAGTYINDCAFNGGTNNWSLAAIYSAAAHLNFFYDSVTLTGNATISQTSGATGVLSNVIAGGGSTVGV